MEPCIGSKPRKDKSKRVYKSIFTYGCRGNKNPKSFKLDNKRFIKMNLAGNSSYTERFTFNNRKHGKPYFRDSEEIKDILPKEHAINHCMHDWREGVLFPYPARFGESYMESVEKCSKCGLIRN
jgi:hypothetical protein